MTATQKNIILLPNNHLRERSKRVGLIDPQVIKLAEDMQAATLDWEASRSHEVGVALAAIQLDKAQRVIVIRNSLDDKNDKSFNVLINPVVTKCEGEIEKDFEGCLSVPDIYGKVPRYTKVRVKAINLEGHEFRLKAEGFLARILQHEIDHTNGIMFVDHIKDSPKAFFELLASGKLEPLDYEKDVRNSSILW